MDLNILWFILLTVLFSGFFFLEGFDYGVGILLPFVAKEDNERRAIINTIGPVWDANEVWMILAGGAMFAAFPHMYATLFSGFYVALVIMLSGLIIRGVASSLAFPLGHGDFYRQPGTCFIMGYHCCELDARGGYSRRLQLLWRIASAA